MKDNETKEQFIELRAKGVSFEKIAKELGVSKQTLITWSKQFQIEISNLKAIKLEALQEQYYVAKEKRVQLLGKKLEILIKELDKRDISGVPTVKLFELVCKYSRELRDDAETITFRRKINMGDSDFVDFSKLENWEA